jgi:hypothetical protein
VYVGVDEYMEESQGQSKSRDGEAVREWFLYLGISTVLICFYSFISEHPRHFYSCRPS